MIPSRLGDVATVRSGYAFKSADWIERGVPVIKIANVKDGWVTLEGCSFVSEDVAGSARALELRRGDLLISMTGHIGQVAKVRDEGRMLLNQRVGRFTIKDPGRLDAEFLFHWLRVPEVRAMFEAHAYGAAQPNISPSLIEQQTIDLPALPTQRRIASILGTYDDLIEVNRRRIAVLEAMGRRLFDDFLTARVGQLPHPGGVQAELNPPPRGWRKTSLCEVVDLIMGQSPPSGELNTEGRGLPFHQGVTDFGPLFPGRRVFCDSLAGKRTAEAGDILFSVRAPVGRINVATERVVLGRGVAAIKVRPSMRAFLLAHLRATFHTPDLIGNGAIYKAVNRADIERVPIVQPSADDLARLEPRLATVRDCLLNLYRANAALAMSRDLLLPRLISGDLAVATAERELEAIA